jgi:hypothetical protein
MNMKKISIVLLSLILPMLIGAKNIYVSQSTGSDSNYGTSADKPIKTTTKLNTMILSGGDSVLFKRGDQWNFNDGNFVIMKSGSLATPIVYGAYGKGPKPEITRSIVANSQSQWIDQGNNIWKLDQYIEGTTFNTAIISYNNDEYIGFKRFSKADMVKQGDFWVDENMPDPGKTWLIYNYTYVYSVGNPASVYSDIDVVAGQNCIGGETDSKGISNIVIRDLTLKYGGHNGIGIPIGSKNILVDNCDVLYCGGTRQVNGSKPETRRGQCINTQGHIENFEVRNCFVSQGLDGGIALQGYLGNLVVKNVWIHHNIIFKNEYGFEFWGTETNSNLTNVFVENNTFIYNGYGWAYDHVVPYKKRGASIFHWSFNGIASNFYFRNNIFYKDRAPSFYVWDAKNDKWKTAIHLDNNLYFDDSPATATEGEKAIWHVDYKPMADSNWSTAAAQYLYNAKEYEQWKTASGGFDLTSLIEVDPKFSLVITPENIDVTTDFTLKNESPAIGKGIYLDKYVNQPDRWGNKPGAQFNIGAYNGGLITSALMPMNSVDPITYPNPFHNEVYFSHDISGEIRHIKIMDVSGRLIRAESFDSSPRSLNLSSLKSGIYFMEISLKDRNLRCKLIKI